MTNIIPFDFNSNEIRVIQDESGEPWFVAKDVADILEYSQTDKMTKLLDDDEFQNRQIGGSGFNNKGTLLINESGLYSAVLRSKKPQAKKFKKWITSEVLPSIRKTGSYQVSVPQTFAQALHLAAELEEQKELAITQRDLAIKTKAEIGSRREATAMAKASVATRKVNKLEDQLGISENWKQTKAIPWLSEIFNLSRTAYQQIGRKLSSLSKTLEIAPKEIEDTKYGSVKAYNVNVIEKFHEQLVDDPTLMIKYRETKEAA